MRIVRAADCRVMPWKNGGGTTTEIAVHPEGAGLGDFLWRVSMASVESEGPFSAFPGIDRTLTILGGEGIRLSVDGQEAVVLTPGSPPFAFAGDVPASATLIGGPVRDLNVMTRRGVVSHRVTRVAVPIDCQGSGSLLVFCHTGSCSIEAKDERRNLDAGDTAIAEGEMLRLTPSTDGVVYLVEVRPSRG
jgi:environmental stress-induced protein Ves